MKRATLVGLLLAIALAPRLEAQEVSCILKSTCKPLPCEFLAELKLSKAMARIYRNTPVGSNRGKGPSYGVKIFEQLIKAYRPYNAKCPVRTMPQIHGYGSPEPGAKCEIGTTGADGKFQAMTRADFRQASESCTEIEEAQYDRVEVQLAACQAQIESRKISFSDEADRFFSLEAEQRKIASLQTSLLGYLSSCAPDAKLSQQLSKMGLDALRKKGRKNRKEWQAKRAQAAGSSQ